jgi:PAS domain S-box-containing protein
MTLFALARSLKRQHASQAAGFAAVTIAAAAFISWWVSVPLQSSSGSGFATVKPTTALCLAALGLAVVYPGKNSRLAFAVGMAVAAIATLDLLDLFGIDFGINRLNRLLVPQAAVPGPETSFLTINGVPVALELAGGSLALGFFERHRFAATALSGIAGVMAIFALFTYLKGVHSLSIPQTPTPLTAIGLLCVVGAIILRIGTMPALRKPRPLWHLLIVLGCAVIAPLLLFGVFTGLRMTDAELRDARNDLMSGASKLSADVDREIVGEIEKLRTLAASSSLRHGDFAEFQRQAKASLAHQSGNIALVDRNMQELVNTWLTFGSSLPKTVVPESVERVLATGKPQVTGLFMGPVTKRLVYAIIVPVQIDGENRYALVRAPDQHALARAVAANKLPPGRQAVVSDGTRRIIVRSDQQGVFIGRELPRAQWHRAGPDGEFEFIDSEGRPSVEAYAWSELTGWKSAVWAPRALLEAPVRTLWWTIVFMGVLAVALVVGLASWLGRIIACSVDDAARAAIALGEGVSLPLSGSPVAEVDTLMGELQRTAVKRRAAEDLVRQSESIFRAMFEMSSVGKMEVEPGTGRILRANAAMCKLVGYSEAELLARTVLDITHLDDRERTRELGDRQSAGELVAFDLEKRYVRKDGSAVWARTTVNIIPDASGRTFRLTSVIVDINARKQAEEALLASKARLQLALDATQLGWWQYDPLQRKGSGDARANEILDFDIAENEEVAIEELLRRVHPDDVEWFRTAIATALNSADPKPFAIECRIRRQDGKIRWVENHGLAYVKGAGPARRVASLVGTIADITERKEREEREHLLMREVNHRAKNMLSVVDAIAHQTATRNPEDFIERFSERIQALSANQDLLVRNEWNGVEIEDLVRAQLALFADLIGSRIAIQGPKLRLKAASAQAIGLALHELATNAGKYGALSTDRGRVHISWGTDADTLTMSWTERDGPPVSAPKRRGFGTIVMEAMAERSVDGTVELDYAPSGVTWRLSCPAANALERA